MKKDSVYNNAAETSKLGEQSIFEYNCEYRPLAVKTCCADNCPRIFNAAAWGNLSKHCLYRQVRSR